MRTGIVARLAAQRIAIGRVVGLDLNKGMLAVARSVPTNGVPIEWREGSALNLPFEDGSFDLVLCQLGLQFFPDQPLALNEMKRVLKSQGRVALSVYSAIQRTPAAHAFARALDQRLGPAASRTKRVEHIFSAPDEVRTIITGAGFGEIVLNTVTKQITFPSVFDYVRFQLVATPMSALLGDRNEQERDDVIRAIASDTQAFLDPEMLRGGNLSFPQEAYVAVAHSTH
jgi:ubiquinone/menaquinone biosynthesis C-methylase UbiE